MPPQVVKKTTLLNRKYFLKWARERNKLSIQASLSASSSTVFFFNSIIITDRRQRWISTSHDFVSSIKNKSAVHTTWAIYYVRKVLLYLLIKETTWVTSQPIFWSFAGILHYARARLRNEAQFLSGVDSKRGDAISIAVHQRQDKLDRVKGTCSWGNQDSSAFDVYCFPFWDSFPYSAIIHLKLWQRKDLIFFNYLLF